MLKGQEREAHELDDEWVQLIVSAKHLGLSIEEVRAFLNAAHTAAADRS